MLTKPGQSFAPIIGTALLSFVSKTGESGTQLLEARAEVKYFSIMGVIDFRHIEMFSDSQEKTLWPIFFTRCSVHTRN
jgi:hypothetical protein